MINAQVITMSDHKGSYDQAQRCIASSHAVGNDFEINIFEASTPATTDWGNIEYQHLYGHKPNMPACTMSHYRLWQMAADNNEPVLCLEHDAVFLQRFSEEHYWEILGSPFLCVALYNPHGQDDGRDRVLTHLTTGTPAHAYVMRPEGARIMIDTVEREGSISQHDRSKWLSRFGFLGGFKDWIVDDSQEWRQSNLGTSKTM